MANDLYRFFFSLSSLGPIMLIFALVQLVNNQNKVACIVILSIGVSICVLGCVAFCLAIKVIPSEVSSGQISSIEPDTQGTSTFIGAYTLPLLSLFAENNQFVIFIVILVVLSFILIKTNSIPPVLLLMILGYRYYVISLNSGLNNVHLISKNKRFLGTKDLEEVAWLFTNDYWLIDKGGKNV